jgi:hypothetical protein
VGEVVSGTKISGDESGTGVSGVRKRRGKLSYLIMLGVVVAAVGVGSAIGFGKTQQVADLTQGYDLDRAFLGGRGWGNFSWYDGVTLNVLKGGVVHKCMHVHFEDLRAGKPLVCEDGVVFHKK